MPEKELITVAFIDHDKNFFEKSLALLQQAKDIEVCVTALRPDIGKQAPVAQEVANKICKCHPNVFIHSQKLMREALAKDFETVMKIRANIPHTRSVVTFDQYDEETALIAIREGLRGLYLRNSEPSRIVSCVRAVTRGDVWMEAPLIGRVVEEFSRLYKHVDSLRPPTKGQEAKLSLLSSREMEILGLISNSYMNADIGKALFISEKTVKTHIKNIFEKLGVRNRVEATLVVVRSGLTH